jgi:hypothetical protein
MMEETVEVPDRLIHESTAELEEFAAISYFDFR